LGGGAKVQSETDTGSEKQFKGGGVTQTGKSAQKIWGETKKRKRHGCKRGEKDREGVRPGYGAGGGKKDIRKTPPASIKGEDFSIGDGKNRLTDNPKLWAA